MDDFYAHKAFTLVNKRNEYTLLHDPVTYLPYIILGLWLRDKFLLPADLGTQFFSSLTNRSRPLFYMVLPVSFPSIWFSFAFLCLYSVLLH